MSEELPNITTSEKKSFLQSLFSCLFQSEPKNREDLVEVIRDSLENELIDNDTKEMMEGVMEISELRVRDIMIPRPQIVYIDANLPLEACVDLIIESAHSRFPVILDDGKDNIQGMLLAKDLLKYLRSDSAPFDMQKMLRPAVIVPESKRVDRMLKEFRSERFHMAIVVDEFGAVSGLVTIEDILEQIVGDIEDEFDEEEIEPIRQLSRHTYAVSALTDIEKFNAVFATDFVDEEVDTIGGLVMQAFSHLPQRGEQVNLHGIDFKVTSADSRRLIQLRITVSDEQLEQMERITDLEE
ncbi:CNNM family magnesium/cobalt transport protein CorC [[Haemophilus] ducreyi]|uniref:CNNM family magnesium/cobalt transport protein CorC n=1 Tax=Haemophilus ducreyi TaxID=730 RepID=UPI00065537A2|nr:CNNM family magnesium/cobalt transport protein CorC [[Haemophilus] ducreyi]AKO45437.1 magnesium transporter [[Haemophilus] ducreyi]AKO46822.1 magnesium transporter [[Haemophilus] ducreyi]AKO48162.1 magnesium transporter [[Haemophilus] ducreyi]AKO49551.1 magnesium transporter [[Haemophilus] ducreyi]ANF61408.1 magnesium/cobalt efflux protein [[Haemophilus] ducreyi]